MGAWIMRAAHAALVLGLYILGRGLLRISGANTEGWAGEIGVLALVVCGGLASGLVSSFSAKATNP